MKKWYDESRILSTHKLKKIAAILFSFFIFSAIELFAEGEITTINIVSAQKTTYTKAQDTGNDSIILEGNVEISVKKGSTSSDIKADIITYDRKTEMLYAKGNVEITTKSSNSGGETTTADSLIINTSTLEGVFDGGRVIQTKSDALNLPSGSTLIVFSDLFGKTESNTISFKNSSLTFCDDIDPHWHIDATRTWLLPGGEFAFFNALLYVGKVPVIYLPAFYYPKDELIFNPVFATYKRKGYAIQNTYYVIGRKGLSSSSSSSSDSDSASAESLKALYNFMKPTSLKVQERQGLMLHNLDENFNGNTSEYLKIMADYYSNLGYMVGIDGNFQPSKDYIKSLKFNFNLGLSKTVFNNNGNYTALGSDDKIYWDHSNFMGLKLPVRYGANLDLSLSKPINVTLQMPIYSDPYFYYDFSDRNESMEWISYFLSGDNDKDTSSSTFGSFNWNLKSSYSPKLPASLKTYISTLSMNLSSAVTFGYLSSSDWRTEELAKNYAWKSATPERSFYYPSQITPLKASVSMSGTLFQLPAASKNSTDSSKKTSGNPVVPYFMPDELKSEKQLAKEAEARAKEAAGKETDGSEVAEEKSTLEKKVESQETDKSEFVFLSPLPDLSTSITAVSMPAGLNFKLSYSVSPDFSSQMNYGVKKDEKGNITNYTSPTDFKFSDKKSTMVTFKMPTSLSSSLNYGGSFFSMTNKLSYDPIWQSHPNKDGIKESEEKTLTFADYKASSQSILNSNSISIKPFAYVPAFADTSISWNSSLKLFKYEFIGKSSDENWQEKWKNKNEAWDTFWIWDCFDESNWADDENLDAEKAFKQKFITAHSLNFNFAANQSNSRFKQNLGYSVTLPPQYIRHTVSLNLTFPYINSSFSWGATQSNSDLDGNNILDDWTYNNFNQSATLSLFDSKLKFSESYSLVTDKTKNEERDKAISNKNYSDFKKFLNHSDNLKFSLNWQKLTASYVMSYTYDYKLEGTDNNKEWKQKEKEFLPYTLSLSYSPSIKSYTRWGDKLSVAPSFSTSVTADLIKSTNSYFVFTPSLNFKINKLLDISFSASSKNSTLYWYFQEDGPYKDKGKFFADRMLVDLVNSFGIGKNMFEEGEFRKYRESSGFKIKSLNMTASHDLHDWSFNMIWKIEPKLVQKPDRSYEYNFDPYISIAIVWNPMNSMKTAIVHELDTDKAESVWKLNP